MALRGVCMWMTMVMTLSSMVLLSCGQSPILTDYEVGGEYSFARYISSGKKSGGEVFQVGVDRKLTNYWDVRVAKDIQLDLRDQDTVMLAFWIRSGNSERVVVDYGLGLANPPYTSIIENEEEVGPEWKIICAVGVVKADFLVGSVNMVIAFGHKKQVIDLGGYNVFNFNLNPDVDVSCLTVSQLLGPEPSTPAAEDIRNFKLDPGNQVTQMAPREWYGYGQISDEEDVAAETPNGWAHAVTVSKKPEWENEAGATHEIDVQLTRGDIVAIAIWARAAPGTTGEAVFVLEQAFGSYEGFMVAKTRLTDEWNVYVLKGIVLETLGPRKSQIAVNLGSRKQTVELGPSAVFRL